ncbi:MAG: sensor histidine kinase [Phycisphaerales bacterium]
MGKSDPLTFRPRARIIHLLGDQLIRDAGIAVFELVKNAYDADASECTVTMHHVADPDRAYIVVEDNGVGMTYATVRDVWLELGTEYRSHQKEEGTRTEKGRLPRGEKGIGRFAVHKLGRQIKMITRTKDSNEVVVDLDWESIFSQPKYLSEIPIPVLERESVHFKKRASGTRIEIRGLREVWTRGKVRDLWRSVTSICSPFEESTREDEFQAALVLEPDPGGWLKGLLDIADMMELSIFRGKGTIEGDTISYDYEFMPPPAMHPSIKGRKLLRQEAKVFGSMPEDIENALPGRRPAQRPIDLDDYEIGPVSFAFYIFDREPMVLDLATSDKTGLKKFLDTNGGVRVYREDVRVYDFGEPGNDWLDLGGRRVNIPVRRISNNQIIGAITLDGQASAKSLVEKTNREGFVENDAYAALRVAVLCALHQVETERYPDKDRLRRLYSRGKVKAPVVEDLAELRERLKEKRLLDELGPIVDRVEKQFLEVRDQLITAAGAGLSLTVVLHEVEKIIDEAVAAVDRNAQRGTISQLVHHLSEVVDGLAFLVRSSGRNKERASVLIKQALFNFDYRFRAHGIEVINGMSQGDPDFHVRCVRRLVVSTLTNLLDNCIYWLDNKGGKNKRIYIGTTRDLTDGPSFVVADNGPGFRPQDTPEYLVQPFFSRKEDGMGLGLHIANEVAKIHKGQLIFPDRDDVALPKGINGAVVALYIPIAGDVKE